MAFDRLVLFQFRFHGLKKGWNSKQKSQIAMIRSDLKMGVIDIIIPS